MAFLTAVPRLLLALASFVLSANSIVVVYNNGSTNIIDTFMADTSVRVSDSTTLLLAPSGSVSSPMQPGQESNLANAINVQGKSTIIAQEGASIEASSYTPTNDRTTGGTALSLGSESSADIRGGSFLGGNAISSTTCQMFGGRALLIGSNTYTMITGGYFKGGDTGTIGCGGEVGGDTILVSQLKSGTFTIKGGSFTPGNAGKSGSGKSLIVLGSSTIDIYGGLFYGDWILHGFSSSGTIEVPFVNVHGRDLLLTRRTGGYDYLLTGYLCDGSRLRVRVDFTNFPCCPGNLKHTSSLVLKDVRPCPTNAPSAASSSSTPSSLSDRPSTTPSTPTSQGARAARAHLSRYFQYCICFSCSLWALLLFE